MKSQTFFSLILIVLIFTFVPLEKIPAQDNNGKITSAAIWNPSMQTMDEITTNCGGYQGKDLEQCFVSVMQKSGASKQAIAFTGLLGNKGYMKGFRKLKLVDAAFVYFPLRQSDHEGCMLVNGSPAILDVDDNSILDMNDMEKDPLYTSLAQQFQEISLWPGDRQGTDYPYVETLPHKSERVVVNYRLRNGCNTCNLIGFVEFGFDFDSTGAFLGTKFLSIKKAVIAADETSTGNNLKNIYDDPSVPINVNVGDEFALVLSSNHSMGFSWQLAKPLDANILSMLGTDFIIPNETLPDAAGKETWSFKAVGKGTTKISLKYVRSWDKAETSYETETFNINVN
jgi:predicted secreted protein